MRYSNSTMTKAKAMLVSRMQYLIGLRLKGTTGVGLAASIRMSPSIISKLRNGVSTGISMEAVLEAADRLDIRYTLSLINNGKGDRDVELKMEDVKDSRARVYDNAGKHQHSPRAV